MKMNSSSYKTYDDLPLMLSVPDVAVVRGSAGLESTSWRTAENSHP